MLLKVLENLVLLNFCIFSFHASASFYNLSLVFESFYNYLNIRVTKAGDCSSLSAGQVELSHEDYDLNSHLTLNTDLLAATWLPPRYGFHLR